MISGVTYFVIDFLPVLSNINIPDPWVQEKDLLLVGIGRVFIDLYICFLQTFVARAIEMINVNIEARSKGIKGRAS